MRDALKRLASTSLRVLKRFATSSPANTYEAIIFGAVRRIVINFGKAVPA